MKRIQRMEAMSADLKWPGKLEELWKEFSRSLASFILPIVVWKRKGVQQTQLSIEQSID